MMNHDKPSSSRNDPCWWNGCPKFESHPPTHLSFASQLLDFHLGHFYDDFLVHHLWHFHCLFDLAVFSTFIPSPRRHRGDAMPYISVYRKLREKLGYDGNVYDSDSSHWYERPQVEKFLHKYRQAEQHIGWPAWGPSFPHISPESAMAAKWQRHVVDKSKHLHFGNLSYHFADFHFGHLP